MRHSWPAGLVGLLALLPFAAIYAQSMTLYLGQGVDSDLTPLPSRLLRNELIYDESYFAAVGWIRRGTTPDWLARGGQALLGVSPESGSELILVKHWGLQSNGEINLAWRIGTPPAHLGLLALQANFAIGLSWAMGTPSYEDGSLADPERRYRLQNYNAYEIAWWHREHPRWQLATRIHHRSGIYGLIAPRRVGSNFMTVGVRYRY
jgi:hypothetical protein